MTHGRLQRTILTAVLFAATVLRPLHRAAVRPTQQPETVTSMSQDDEVILLAAPFLFGLGVIDAISREGRVAVEWPDERITVHAPHELETFDYWISRQPDVAETLRALGKEPA